MFALVCGCKITVEVPQGPGQGQPTGTSPSSTVASGTAPTIPDVPCNGTCQWQIETIDHVRGSGSEIAADVDADGRIHVLVYDEPSNDQYPEFRYLNSDDWWPESLDLWQQGYVWLDLAVSSDGVVHVAITDQSHMYFRRTASGAWQWANLGVIDLFGGKAAAIALDGDDPVLFFGRHTWWSDGDGFTPGPELPESFDVRDVVIDGAGVHGLWQEDFDTFWVGTLDGSTWDPIAAAGSSVEADLVGDEASGWHIVSWDVGWSGTQVDHTWQDGGRWHEAQPASWSESSWESSSVMGPDGHVWVVYGATGPDSRDQLVFAWNDGTDWQRETVSQDDPADTYLLVDPTTNRPIVVFIERRSGEVRVARAE